MHSVFSMIYPISASIIPLISAARALHEKYGGRVSFAVMGYTEGDMEEEFRAACDEGIIREISFECLGSVRANGIFLDE